MKRFSLVFAALAADMKDAVASQTASKLASRINFEHGGLRSVFMKTTRVVNRTEQGRGSPSSWRPTRPGARPASGRCCAPPATGCCRTT